MLPWLVLGVPAFLVVLQLVVIVPAKLYVMHERRRKTAGPPFAGKVAVFVPCKGWEADLEENLDAVARQEHPDFTVTYITERESDPACEAIQRVVARRRNTSHVVAGLAHRCGQKNHNLLAGVAAHGGDAKAFVFCDADVRPGPGWLQTLLAPLADAETPVASGYKWHVPANLTVGSVVHAMLNAFQLALLANKVFPGVWGGSLAIRRDFWERYQVGARWSETVVDDISTAEILRKNGIARKTVPECVIISPEGIAEVHDMLDWWTRQLLYVRYHLFPLFAFAVTSYLLAGVVTLAIPFELTYGLWMGEALWVHAGLAGLVFLVSFAALMLVVRSMVKTNFAAWRWVVMVPIAVVLNAASFFEAATSRTMRWRGITYTVAPGGRVLAVSRDELPAVESEPELSVP